MRSPVITGPRLLSLGGIVLIAFGTFIALRGLRLHSTGLVQVGPFHSTVQEQHTVPPLFGWVAILAGVLVVVGGNLGKRGKR